ncbi:lysozyme inhibitor LprI family protein [Methylocystis parvus]|uniref:DUF1311 domain-containing protein n=1 Tax=Methylocystis parvus TaxID=134 RepID=A0A6B8M614_9HYPH|nr:lysozyme inhibitor LprI family protein [Methylocystis parvus]QGM96260.1 DUF1311 domain-containing protein [Methylocystis parvus]WBJ99902.1 lysozyme inhibitor LprI family protein [Methylocystis parvus OBBP]
MPRLVFAVIFSGLLLTPAHADACMDKATAQADMNECAAKAFHAADNELNASFRQLQRRLSDDADTGKRLVSAQRAWVAFRDAECAFSSSGVTGGTAYPMIYAMCLEGLTRKRVGDFKSYLTCGDKEGDLSCPIQGSH